MGQLPERRAQHVFPIGDDTGLSSGEEIDSHATAHTKGSWYQIIASTPYVITELFVIMGDTQTARHGVLLDLAIGATSSEQIILSNLMFYAGDSTNIMAGVYHCRVHIPQGTRISARLQSLASAEHYDVALLAIAPTLGSISPAGVMDTYGADESDSGGTAIDAGSSANTKGSWVQLTATTLQDIKHLTMSISSREHAAEADAGFLFDIAIGATSSEEIILADLYIAATGGTDTSSPPILPRLPVAIPKGTRLSVRCQSTSTSTTYRVLDVILYGEN